MRERQRRALMTRIRVQKELGDLWYQVSAAGFTVRQDLDCRDIVVVPPTPDVPLSPGALELRRRGPEVFDMLESLDRLMGVVLAVEPPPTWRDR
jgi:hypothetical protein